MEQIKKDFRLLSDDGQYSVRKFYMLDATNNDDILFCKEAMKAGWITIDNGRFILTKKGIELRKKNVSKMLNVNVFENRVRDDLISKEDALFELDVQIERIEKIKEKINNIDKKTKECEHIAKPLEAYFSQNQFGNAPFTFTWVSQCELCKKKTYVITNLRSEAPKEFKDIKVSNRTLPI